MSIFICKKNVEPLIFFDTKDIDTLNITFLGIKYIYLWNS